MSKKQIRSLIESIKDDNIILNKLFSQYSSKCKYKTMFIMSMKFYECNRSDNITSDCHWSDCPKLKRG